MSRIEYTSDAIAVCAAARSLPNPPTGTGADVQSWDVGSGATGQAAVDELELTVLAGATVELAAGAILLAQEVHNTYPEESASVSVANATDTLTLTSHGFSTGDGPVRVSGAVVPTGLSATTEYYVYKTGANTFKLATSRANALAGTVVNITADGTTVLVHWVTGIKSVVTAITSLDATANTLTLAAHGLDASQRVQLSNSGGALPTGFSADTDYYVIVTDADTFQLASSANNAAAGTAIDFSGGSGTQSVIHNEYGPTSATQYVQYLVLNEGEAIDLAATVGYCERIVHRPGVVAYHLAAVTDVFVPITAYVRGVRTVD